MRKKGSFVLLTLLLSQIVVSAVVPLVVAGVAIGLFGAFLAGVAVDHFVLMPDVNQLIAEKDAQTKANLDIFIPKVKTDTDNAINYVSDATNFSDAYAWLRAKYLYVKSINEGKSQAEAVSIANTWIYNYYYNYTTSLINQWNTSIETLYLMAKQYNSLDPSVRTFYDPNPGYEVEHRYASSGCRSGSGALNEPKVGSIHILGQDFKYKYFDALVLKYYVPAAWYCSATSTSVNPNLQKFLDTLKNIDLKYNMIVDNLAVYLQSISAAGVNVSIDPYMLAIMMNTDLNSTGYYGFAVSELALAGLPVIGGINTTVDITTPNGTFSGWIFTDWDKTFNRSDTYTIPQGKIFYIVTPDGSLIKVNPGTNVTFDDIRDTSGKTINSTTVVRYIQHSGDSADAYKELQKLIDLYKQYLDMKASVAPPSKGILDQLIEWWNSLTTEQKILVVAGAGLGFILLIYALRGRGGGTVVLKG